MVLLLGVWKDVQSLVSSFDFPVCFLYPRVSIVDKHAPSHGRKDAIQQHTCVRKGKAQTLERVGLPVVVAVGEFEVTWGIPSEHGYPAPITIQPPPPPDPNTTRRTLSSTRAGPVKIKTAENTTEQTAQPRHEGQVLSSPPGSPNSTTASSSPSASAVGSPGISSSSVITEDTQPLFDELFARLFIFLVQYLSTDQISRIASVSPELAHLCNLVRAALESAPPSALPSTPESPVGSHTSSPSGVSPVESPTSTSDASASDFGLMSSDGASTTTIISPCSSSQTDDVEGTRAIMDSASPFDHPGDTSDELSASKKDAPPPPQAENILSNEEISNTFSANSEWTVVEHEVTDEEFMKFLDQYLADHQ